MDGALEAALHENQVVDLNLYVMPLHSAGHKAIHVLGDVRSLEVAVEALHNLNKFRSWVSTEVIAKVNYTDQNTENYGVDPDGVTLLNCGQDRRSRIIHIATH